MGIRGGRVRRSELPRESRRGRGRFHAGVQRRTLAGTSVATVPMRRRCDHPRTIVLGVGSNVDRMSASSASDRRARRSRRGDMPLPRQRQHGWEGAGQSGPSGGVDVHEMRHPATSTYSHSLGVSRDAIADVRARRNRRRVAAVARARSPRRRRHGGHSSGVTTGGGCRCSTRRRRFRDGRRVGTSRAKRRSKGRVEWSSTVLVRQGRCSGCGVARERAWASQARMSRLGATKMCAKRRNVATTRSKAGDDLLASVFLERRGEVLRPLLEVRHFDVEPRARMPGVASPNWKSDTTKLVEAPSSRQDLVSSAAVPHIRRHGVVPQRRSRRRPDHLLESAGTLVQTHVVAGHVHLERAFSIECTRSAEAGHSVALHAAGERGAHRPTGSGSSP